MSLLTLPPPPSGKLSLFNLYVALSRSSGRETIRLLDDEIFLEAHEPELVLEDDVLPASKVYADAVRSSLVQCIITISTVLVLLQYPVSTYGPVRPPSGWRFAHTTQSRYASSLFLSDVTDGSPLQNKAQKNI